jgi:antitoxin PrlF
MPTATVTSKGQITIPVGVRHELHLETGSRVAFVRIAPGVYQLVPETASVRDIKGAVQRSGQAASLEDMDAAIEAEAAERGSS